MPVADKGTLLFFGNETDVLPDVAFGLSLWHIFLVVLMEIFDRGKKVVVPATFRDAGGVDWLSFDGVDGLLLFHSSYYKDNTNYCMSMPVNSYTSLPFRLAAQS